MGFPMLASVITLLLVLLSSSSSSAQGHNGCKDDNWSYHASTHSCFRLFREAKMWYYARNHCENILGGPTGSEKGHLAKIDDEETNTFVKKLLGTNGSAWIGLNDATERGTLRWAGFRDEVPGFIKLQEDQRTDVYAYISGSIAFWRKTTYSEMINRNKYFICQSDSGIIESTLTCPGPGPVRQNTTLTRNPTITFAFSQWQYIYWYVNAKRVGYCTRQTCTSEETGFASTYTDGSSTLTYGKPITRRYEGEWICKITTANNVILADKSCAIDVYEPPDVVTCSHKLERDKVSVVCETNRIYPKVSCKWYHKNEKDVGFIAVDKQEVSDKNDQFYTEGSNRDKYFKSSCSVNLTKSLTNVQLGQMTVKVRMYPTLNNYDLSTTHGAYSEKEVTVLIESPKKPVFYLNETKVVGNSLDVVDGETINLKCAVKGGKPSVKTTTMKCGSSSGPAKRGVTNWKEIHVTRSMNGQRCECFGNHIAGKSETTVLTLKVLYAASVDSFKASRSSYMYMWTQLTVNPKTQVYLSCQSSGNPSPDIKILKRNVGTEDDVLKSTTGVDPLKTSFKAECLDNGKYQCLAENTVGGKRHKKTSELDIHVRCPPTLCKGQEDNSSFVANVGQKKVVKICAVSYPQPSQLDVNLLKMTTGKWKAYDSTKFSVRHVLSSSNTLKEVEITFNQVQSSDHGQFRLDYYSSYLHFHLSPKSPPDCPTNVTADMLGRLEANISWVPGEANGHPQTFVIAQYKKHATQDKTENVSDSMQANSEGIRAKSTPSLGDAIKTYTVEKSDNSDGDPMAFLLTDLKPGHEFIFFVVARNELGSRKCPDAFVNFTTMREQESQTDDDISWKTVVAVVVPVIVIVNIILVIIGVIVLRRRTDDSGRPESAVRTNTLPDPTSLDNREEPPIYLTPIENPYLTPIENPYLTPIENPNPGSGSSQQCNSFLTPEDINDTTAHSTVVLSKRPKAPLPESNYEEIHDDEDPEENTCVTAGMTGEDVTGSAGKKYPLSKLTSLDKRDKAPVYPTHIGNPNPGRGSSQLSSVSLTMTPENIQTSDDASTHYEEAQSIFPPFAHAPLPKPHYERRLVNDVETPYEDIYVTPFDEIDN